MTATAWHDVPTITIYRPTCPVCGHWGYVLVRSADNGDSTRTRYAVCKRCSGRFKIIVELPLSGKGALGTP
ncbi:MAG: hypothetical protein GXY58_08650 [Planctomycetaceae bacterium]|nr:hypothetical protein [Planctomycetaceae bacterium]